MITDFYSRLLQFLFTTFRYYCIILLLTYVLVFLILSEEDSSDGFLLFDEFKSFRFSANFDSKLVLIGELTGVEALVLGIEGLEESVDWESLEDEKWVGNFLERPLYCYRWCYNNVETGWYFFRFNLG